MNGATWARCGLPRLGIGLRKRAAQNRQPGTGGRPGAPDQAARIAKLGGREAILAKGSFGHSPVPGTKPIYN